MGRYGNYGGWAPYVPVANRRQNAQKEVVALKKKGHICQPIAIEGRAIARTFWGKAWCDNLEAYSDYANRLPRGRTYVRNGSVVDLQILAGKVTALVAGSELYEVSIGLHALENAPWKAILKECAGKIASLIELLQGRLSKAVMEVVTRKSKGLFPMPREISFRCSCPDGAWMCKHVAATLYGVGARLDSQPELLFQLRHVNPQDLIQQTGDLSVMASAVDQGQLLETTDLSGLFGIELDAVSQAADVASPTRKKAPTIRASKSGAINKPSLGNELQLIPKRVSPKIKNTHRQERRNETVVSPIQIFDLGDAVAKTALGKASVRKKGSKPPTVKKEVGKPVLGKKAAAPKLLTKNSGEVPVIKKTATATRAKRLVESRE